MRTNCPTPFACSTRIDTACRGRPTAKAPGLPLTAMAACLLWGMSTLAVAVDADVLLSKEHHACMEKSGGVTVDMRACLSAELARQDARLNKAYQQLQRKLDAAAFGKLKSAQRAWIAFRNANCEFAGAQQGEGTLGPVIVGDCHLQMTARRATELEQALKSE